MLVLSGLVSKGHHIADRAYPTKGKGSCKHLQQNKVEDRDMMVTLQMLGEKFGISRPSFLENLCCEARPERDKVWDLFYRGQSLVLLRPVGVDGKMAVYCKPYGEKEWNKLFPL